MDPVALAHAAFDAAQTRNLPDFLATFTPDATVWHNFDASEEPAQQAAAKMIAMAQMFTALSYEKRRYQALPDGAVLQHEAHCTVPDGRQVVVPMMIRLYARDGRIQRLEEYLDTQAMAALRPG